MAEHSTPASAVWWLMLVAASFGVGAAREIKADERGATSNIARVGHDLANALQSVVTDEPYMKVVEDHRAHLKNLEPYVSRDGRFAVDVSAYEKLTLTLSSWPVDEFMYFLAGRVRITDAAGHTRTFGPGDSMVMPRGFSGRWEQLSPIKKIAVSVSAAASAGAALSDGSVSLIDVSADVLHGRPLSPLGEEGSANFHLLHGANAGYLEIPIFTSADRHFAVVVKRYDAIEAQLRDWPIDEYIHVLAGTIELMDATGTHSFGSGQDFVIPKGYTGTWRQRQRIDMLTLSYGVNP